MKKLLLLLISIILFSGTAMADHWRQTGSLLPGTYMLVYTNVAQTAQSAAMDAWAELQGQTPVVITEKIRDAFTLTITEEYNAAGLVKFLNFEPVTTPDREPVLFKLNDKGKWIQVEMPCVWTKGDGVT